MMTNKQANAAFARLTDEEKMAAFYRAQHDPYCRMLNEISACDTQLESAKFLRSEAFRYWFEKIEIGRRKELMAQVAELIDEKPINYDD